MSRPIPQPCPDCGHRHEGPGLAWVCVGCPCPTRPGLTAGQLDYLRAALVASAAAIADDDSDYAVGRRRGYEHAVDIIDMLIDLAMEQPA